MVLTVQCEGGHWLAVDEHLAGTVVRCAECKRLVCVPPMAVLVAESGVKPPPLPRQLAPAAQTPPGGQPTDSPWSDAPPPVGAVGRSASSESTVELRTLRPPPRQCKPQPAPAPSVPSRQAGPSRKGFSDAIIPVPPSDGESHLPTAILLPETSRSLPVAPPRIGESQAELAATGVPSFDEPITAPAGGIMEGELCRAALSSANADVTIPAAGLPQSPLPPIAADGRLRRRRSVGRRTPSPIIVPPDAYQADHRWVTLVKHLAIGLAAAVLFSLLPVLAKGALNLAVAPPWAQVVLLLSALQVAFVLWLLAVPDWASLRVLMYVFAAAAAMYALGGALALAAPAERLAWLGLDEVQHAARSWCGAAMAVMMLASYVCGRCASRWRQACRQQLAARRRTA